MDTIQLRNLVVQVTGRTDVTTVQMEHFLALFGGELNETINTAIRGFIKHHFGEK